jgi:hypothetical protein
MRLSERERQEEGQRWQAAEEQPAQVCERSLN